ncbi:MAG TPA: peptidoglycan-binding protein [Acidimicrobiia bacterium]|nr:peptidoglycan-binding protein [Acidimicrobiia bacterium]
MKEETQGGRRGGVIIALAVLFALLPAAPAGAAEPVFTLRGGGYGHSVGMSQFGAYGMARAGYSWEQIMTHYFTGATPGEVPPAVAAEPIWVNLTMEQAALTLTVRSIGAGPWSDVTFTSTAGSVAASPGETVGVSRLSNGSCRVSAPGGAFDGPCAIDADWDGFSGSPTAGVILGGCTKINWNLPTGGQAQPCTYARGGLRIRPDNNTNTVNLSVELTMEDYILGISEMPYFWADRGGMAALEAQAVAARSYAYARIRGRAAPEDRPWCWCSLYDTPVDQNYVGWGHGTQAWVNAVANTTNVVMYHPSVGSGGEPISTFYSSSTYGVTEPSENGFSAVVPYLRSVDDHWSQLPEVGNHHARWERSFTGPQLASNLPGMSSVTGLAITKCSVSGAALEITFYGSGGPRAFKTRDLRGLLSLRSMQVYEIAVDGTTTTSCPGSGTSTTSTSTSTTTTTIPATTTTTTIPATTTTIPATTTTVPTATCPAVPDVDTLVGERLVLWAGATGQSVLELQEFLTAIGFPAGPIDGIFGSLTEGAVRKFQSSRSLASDGVVGSRTRSEILSIMTAVEQAEFLRVEATLLRAGATGAQVEQLQRYLRLIGFDAGPADGIFGPLTERALRSYQATNQLLIDGIVGPQTRLSLAATGGIDNLIYCP